MDPLLKTGDTQLKETDEVQDSVRLAQYRIAQFDQLHQKLDDTKEKVNKVKTARQSLESRAGELADHFNQLENRFVNANRKMCNDRECRLEEMISNFANQVVTFDKLYGWSNSNRCRCVKSAWSTRSHFRPTIRRFSFHRRRGLNGVLMVMTWEKSPIECTLTRNVTSPAPAREQRA